MKSLDKKKPKVSLTIHKQPSVLSNKKCETQPKEFIMPMVERTRLINEYLDYKKHLIFPHWNLPTKKNPLIIKDNTK